VADAVRAIGVTEVAHDRWRQEHGGLKTNQVRRLKALELQNQRLRRAVADLTLDKQILAEAAWGVKGVSEPVRWSGFSPERAEPLSPAWPLCLCRAHQADADHL
jgi:hypothetical protein